MKVKICDMTLKELERKFESYELEKRKLAMWDDVQGIRGENAPDRTLKEAVELAKKIQGKLKAAERIERMRLCSRFPESDEWKESIENLARLSLLQDICKRLTKRSSC